MSEITDLDGYELVIGLEVHGELATATKLFCGCPNHFGDEPNTNVCPVCLGLPGSMPVLNARAVEFAMRLGRALTARCGRRFRPQELLLPGHAEGLPGLPVRPADQRRRPPRPARRHPDRHRAGPPRGGHRQVDPRRGANVATRAASTTPATRWSTTTARGVPLVEIVSRPDLRTADQARAYAGELRAVLVGHRGLRRQDGGGVDAGRRQRVGAPPGDAEFGTRCEIKNLNSLRSLGRAIDYEARRQVDLLEAGERVRPADPPLGRGRRPHPHAALQGGGRGLPLLPRARPRPARARPRPTVAGIDAALPPPAGRAPCRLAERRRRRRPTSGWPSSSTAASTTSPWRHRGRRRPRPHADPRRQRPGPRGRRRASTPADLAALVGMEVDGELTASQAKQVLAEMAATGTSAGRDRGRARLRGGGHRRARAAGRRADRGQPRRVGSGSATARTRCRASSSAR